MKNHVELISKQLASWFLRKTAGGATRRVGDTQISVSTDIGLVRRMNQDRLAITRLTDGRGGQGFLVALSDGMGGMRDGEVCAAMAVAAFFAKFSHEYSLNVPVENALADAIKYANSSIFDVYRGGGGATLSAVFISEQMGVHGVNVGDSRIYLSELGLLKQVSVDDTIMARLPEHAGLIDVGNRLLQFVGVGPEIEPHIIHIEASEGARLLLTSDGVHFYERSVLEGVVNNSSDNGVVVKRLVEISKWLGGSDNASAALISVLPLRDVLPEKPSFVFEVWDAFGEMQLFIDPDYSLNSISTMRSIKGHEARELSKGDGSEETDNADLRVVAEKMLPKKKRSTRKASARKKVEQKTGSLLNDEAPQESMKPELKIEFNKK